MIKIDRKLNAFTILEVTISMIIAALSIGIAYSAYTIMKQSYRKYDERNKLIAEIVLADKLLKKDFFQAIQIVKSEKELVFKSAGGIISYTLDTRYILRNQYNNRRDTFNIPVQDSKLYYAEDLKSTELVRRLDIKTTVDGTTMQLNYEKKYSAENLMAERNSE